MFLLYTKLTRANAKHIYEMWRELNREKGKYFDPINLANMRRYIMKEIA